jgi:hypothetical protein
MAGAAQFVSAARALEQQRRHRSVDRRLHGARLSVYVYLRIVPGEDVVGGVLAFRRAGQRVHQHASLELQVTSLALALHFHAARLSFEFDDLEERGKRDALHCYLCAFWVTEPGLASMSASGAYPERLCIAMTLPATHTCAGPWR